MSRAKPGPSLDEQRRETLARLESLLESRQIGADEYRERAEVARRATDETELATVRPERPLHPKAAPAPAPRAAAEAGEPYDETGYVFACMGGSVRKGPWEPPETLYALSLMGGIELDFRQAALLEGVTDVVVCAVMGGVKITVPDDIDVEVSGLGIMGGFEHVSQHDPGSDRPLLRIKGVAVMGGVSVKIKPAPGSTPARRLVQKVRQIV